MPDGTCQICKHWKRGIDNIVEYGGEHHDVPNNKGKCHRYPKSEQTADLHWCGEFRHKGSFTVLDNIYEILIGMEQRQIHEGNYHG